MLQRVLTITAIAMLTTLVTPLSSGAAPITLTFDGDEAGLPEIQDSLIDEDPISQSYGDGPEHDVSYASRLTNGDSAFLGELRYWSTQMGTLEDLAFCCDGPHADSVGEITIIPEPGKGIRLISFDLAAYDPDDLDIPLDSQFQIFTNTYELLYSSGPLSISAITFSHFVVDIVNLHGGLILQWGPDGYDVGIDNVQFEVIPEPASLALLGIGLAAVGLHRWRARK